MKKGKEGLIHFAEMHKNDILYIVVTEARSSDSIVVWNWTGKQEMNPVTIKNKDHFTDEVYKNNRHDFGYLDIKNTVEFIENLIRDHVGIVNNPVEKIVKQ